MTTEAAPAEPGRTVPHRALLTGCVMLATLMQILDSTIATVALPYMQGSMSASADEITWVLTSYVAASAVMTAPVGWMAHRFGRKGLFIACLIGFTATSMMCGAAQSLGQIVGFRIVQGMCGAAMVPLSQAVMLDIYPFEQRAQAMAIFGIGIMVGPIMGPTLGGWLTDAYNWRWVFYINLPLGIIAVAGLAIFMPRSSVRPDLRFDWMGFAVLALGIGSLQIMLDRGQDQDWFNSREIVTEAVLAALGIYLFLVHMVSGRQPLIRPELFKDVNFTSGLALMFAVGTLLVSSIALMAPWLQNLGNYPVATAGLMLAPRGLGNMITIVLSGRLSQRIDARVMVGVGLLLECWSFWIMTGWTPDVSHEALILTIILQGAGVGLIFTPLQMLAFATIDPALRTEGAGLFSLFRNIGAAVGVSVVTTVLARNTQVLHESIGADVNPFNRALGSLGTLNPAHAHGAALLDRLINQQAQIIAYVDDYKLLILTTLPAILLLLVMRRPRQVVGASAVRAEAMD